MSTTKQDRVRLLLRKLWENSQSKMAIETAVSQSTISNIVRGRYEPGGKVMTAIAGHPLVNAQWLMTGEGTPFDVEQQWVLPIATSLLPGSVEEQAGILTGETMAVASKVHRESRYFFRTPAIEQLFVMDGDLLLLETDTGAWDQMPAQLLGKLCAFVTSQKAKAKRRVALGRVAELLTGVGTTLVVQPVWPRDAKQPSAKSGRQIRERSVLLDKGKMPSGGDTADIDMRIRLKQIVAVAQTLVRLRP